MHDSEALELFAQLVEKKLNHKITEVQRILFQCFWNKLSYQDIAEKYNLLYNEDYYRELGRQLNNLAKNLCGCHGKVNKTNFRLVLEHYLQEQIKASKQPRSPIVNHWDLHSRWFYLVRQAEKRDWYTEEDYWDFVTLTQQMIESINQDEKYHHYQEIADRWKLIKNFTHVYDQYWQERKQILEWLLEGAKKNNDHLLIAEAFSELGLTLTLLYPHDKEAQSQAEFHLTEARKLAINQEISLWVDVNINIAVLSLAQQQPENANGHLVTAYKSLSDNRLDANLQDRCLSNVYYYFGECDFRLEKYKEANEQYKWSKKYAKAIGWKRAEVAADNWRAEIAIELGKLDVASKLLKNGLQIVTDKKDYRSMALHYRSLVWLMQKNGDQNQVLQYAINAQSKFQMLGMDIEAQEMQQYIRGN